MVCKMAEIFKEIKLFWQKDCGKCPTAKNVLTELERVGNVRVKITSFDIGTLDGMTEAAYHEVLSTPTTIVVDKEENELAAWRGEPPTLRELENMLIKE
jgi:thiol-disulfide isomerase/thioredoxin